MSKTANRPRQLFEPGEVYTVKEIAERLKTTEKAVVRKIDNRAFAEGGVIGGWRSRRVWGWALNEFIAANTF